MERVRTIVRSTRRLTYDKLYTRQIRNIGTFIGERGSPDVGG